MTGEPPAGAAGEPPGTSDALGLDPATMRELGQWVVTGWSTTCAASIASRPSAPATPTRCAPRSAARCPRGPAIPTLRNRTLELTRRWRALKLWLILRIHGAQRLRSAVAEGIEFGRAGRAAAACRRPLGGGDRGPVGDRHVRPAGAGEDEHSARAAVLGADGFAAVTSTSLAGRSVLRLCTINPRTTVADVAETLNRLAGGARSGTS